MHVSRTEEFFVLWPESVRILCLLETREQVHGLESVTRVSLWDWVWVANGKHLYCGQSVPLIWQENKNVINAAVSRLHHSPLLCWARCVCVSRRGTFCHVLIAIIYITARSKRSCQSTKLQSKSTLWRQQKNNNNTILPRLAQTSVSMDLWIWETILKQSGCAVGCVDISVLADSGPLTGSSAWGAESQPCFLLLKRSLMLRSDNSLPAASRPLFWSQLSEWWGWLRLEQWAPFVLLKGDRKHWFQPLPGL